MGGVDIKWNLLHGIPFPDGSMSRIFSSHVPEHFSYWKGQWLPKEFHRVLKPSGAFLITVPNAKLYLDSYSGQGENFMKHRHSFYQPAFVDTGS